MRTIRGDKLSPKLRAHVLAAYVHRNTHEHPFPLSGGKPMSDEEWLRSHAFYVTKNGELSRRHTMALPACIGD